MPKLRSLAPLVRTIDTRIVRSPPKVKLPIYNSPEFIAWRAMVLVAGYRCEAVDRYGHRCERAAPHHRIYADHIVELRDNGAPFDPAVSL